LTYFITGTLAWLLSVAPAVAQEAQVATTETNGEVSFFEQFFWSEDPLGLLVIWLLLVMSALSIGFALKLFLTYRRASIVPKRTHDQIQTFFADKQFRDAIEYANNDRSYLGKLIAAALNEASAGYNAMERAIEEEGDFETSRMLRPVEYLNVVGNIAPMLGLFGTVYGMILAFQQLVAAGGKPNPAELAAGISTALVTTFWGLIVAMPALAAYALVRNKIDALTSEGITIAADLIHPFKPHARKQQAAAEAEAEADDEEDEDMDEEEVEDDGEQTSDDYEV
jgi:biopolymer transport protein ExbB